MANLSKEEMRRELMRKLQTRTSNPVPVSPPPEVAPSDRVKRKRVKGGNSRVGGSEAHEDLPVDLSNDDGISYAPGERIFCPNWDLKEHESVLGDASAGRRYLQRGVLLSDAVHLRKLSNETLFSQTAQHIVGGLAHVSEVIKRCEIIIAAEADNKNLIANYEGEVTALKLDVERLQQKINVSEEAVRKLTFRVSKLEASLEAEKSAYMDHLTMAYDMAFEGCKKQVLAKFSHMNLDLNDITVEAAIAAGMGGDEDGNNLGGGDEEENADFRDDQE